VEIDIDQASMSLLLEAIRLTQTTTEQQLKIISA
jgi:hypothetical protein